MTNAVSSDVRVLREQLETFLRVTSGRLRLAVSPATSASAAATAASELDRQMAATSRELASQIRGDHETGARGDAGDSEGESGSYREGPRGESSAPEAAQPGDNAAQPRPAGVANFMRLFDAKNLSARHLSQRVLQNAEAVIRIAGCVFVPLCVRVR